MGELRFEVDCTANEIHFQEEMEILFVLSGRCAVTAGENNFTLESEGLCVFSPFELHEIMREAGGHTLSLYIPLDYLDQGGVRTISCCSALQPEKTAFLNILRSRLALLFQEYQSPTKSNLYLMSHLTALLGMLRQEFEEEGLPFDKARTEGQRLTAILAYIRDNLEEEVTLQSAAEAFYLSPAHLSRRFRHLTGYGFSDFVRILKLDRAANLLTHSSVSVTEIASRCGFGNANTFINAFQRRYGCTPGKYRKANRNQARAELPGEISFMSLTQYLGQEDRRTLYPQKAEEPVLVQIDTRAGNRELSLAHNKSLNMGYAKDLLLESMQKLLKRTLAETGAEFVFFHGIFDRGMNVYHVDENGDPLLNFIYIDLAVDFLISHRAKPWIALDYTPPELMTESPIYFGESCMNLPGDLEKWEKAVIAILNHFIERYGHNEVQGWRFSPEPAVYASYGVFTLEDYQEYYLRTFRTVRRVIPGAFLSAFGLDTGIVTLEGDDALPRLLRFCREHDCMPDEICFQSFSCDYRAANLKQAEHSLTDQQEDQLEEPLPVSADPDLMRKELAAIREILGENGAAELPIAYHVWNSGIWQRDLGNDTCFKSAWLVKNVLENEGKLSLASVTLADYSERSIINPNVFHGGLGVMTYYGFPKAGYHALSLLSRFRGILVCSGEGYTVTRSADSNELMVMLYHYCHYDMETHLSRQLPQKEQRIYDRYYGFEKKGPRSFQFRLKNLSEGLYEADSYLVNRSWGSSYDIWMNMGAPERFSVEQREYLESVAVPKYQYQKYPVDEKGELLFSVLLEPHEVRLIRLKKR